jgi:metal-sulfur cluster biosynthetic enzyme
MPAGGAAEASARRAAVLAALERVTDPELDEPVTALGFIAAVSLTQDGAVAIDFRLPTYWCAANFAFLMADDMRRAVGALPWVRAVAPRLHDHMYADEVNRGVAEGLDFAASFGALASDEPLDALREKFRRKSFERRQEIMIAALRAAGLDAAAIVALDFAGLAALAPPIEQWERLRARYLERRGEIATAPAGAALVFVTVDGAPLEAAGLPAYLDRLRGVRLNMEFNGALCRGLLAARDRPSEALPADPDLADFLARV